MQREVYACSAETLARLREYNARRAGQPLSKEIRAKISRSLLGNKRDNYTCSVCFLRDGRPLNAHHLLSWEKHPSLRYDVSNGITAHAKCHRAFWHGPSMNLAG